MVKPSLLFLNCDFSLLALCWDFSIFRGLCITEGSSIGRPLTCCHGDQPVQCRMCGSISNLCLLDASNTHIHTIHTYTQYTHTHTQKYIHIHTHNTHAHRHINVHTYTQTYTYTQTHIHERTHIQTCTPHLPQRSVLIHFSLELL